MTTPTTVRAATTAAAEHLYLLAWLALCAAVALAFILEGAI